MNLAIKYLGRKISMNSNAEQPLTKTGRTKDLSYGNIGFLKQVMSVRIRLE